MREGRRAVNSVKRNGDDLCLGPLLSEVPPHVPMLLLSEDGTIQDLTESARRLLGHSPEASIEPCFFSHVHKKNLRRVMHDLAHMVSRQKRRARWLLRLRTGDHRWGWYRIRANRVSSSPESAVRLFLRRL